MKNFLRKYGLMFFTGVFLLGYMIFGVFGVLESNHIEKDRIQSRKELYDHFCETHTIDDFSTEKESETYINTCVNYNYEYDKVNFYILYESEFYNEHLNIFSGLLFFIVVLTIAFYICSLFKNNYLKNYLTRDTYKSFKKKLGKYTLSNILIFPTILLIAFILCALLATSFDVNIPTEMGITTLNNPILYIILHLFIIICYSITYTNIFLISARKNHNPIIALIVSFLLFMGAELFIETSLTKFLSIIAPGKNYTVLFSLINPFYFTFELGLVPTIIMRLILPTLTSIIVYFCYRNKEKLLLDCEKNK